MQHAVVALLRSGKRLPKRAHQGNHLIPGMHAVTIHPVNTMAFYRTYSSSIFYRTYSSSSGVSSLINSPATSHLLTAPPIFIRGVLAPSHTSTINPLALSAMLCVVSPTASESDGPITVGHVPLNPSSAQPLEDANRCANAPKLMVLPGDLSWVNAIPDVFVTRETALRVSTNRSF